MKVLFEMLWFYSTIIFRPDFWLSNEPTYSGATELVKLCINESISFKTSLSTCTTKFEFANGESVELWTEDYPYSYGNLRDYSAKQLLPSRFYRWKLRQFITETPKKTNKQIVKMNIQAVVSKIKKDRT